MSIRIIRLCIALILASGVTSCQSGLFQSHITPAPTPQCVEPTLTLGTATFRVEPVTNEPGRFPEIPSRTKDMAYWLENTTVNYIFALSPTRENLALNTVLKPNDPITINWADCSKDEYVLKSMETIQAANTGIFNQASGITIYVQDDASTLVFRGERPSVQSAETLVPTDENAILVDLEILEFTQLDEQTVQFRINLTNRGGKAITLADDDISLKVEGGPEVPPQKVEPALPQELQPGEPLPITLTFPKPMANSAVLRIFDVTFEYYF